MSRIGKISGRNWDEAPIGATHVNRSLHSRHPWYKVEGDIVRHHNSIDGWHYSGRSDNITHISKEEDLGVQKTVNDIEVGMFLMWEGMGKPYVVCYDGKCYKVISTTTSSIHYLNKFRFGFTHWSYTYEGPYTPFAPIETEEDKKLEALKATIEQAQKQIDEIVRNAK